MKYENQVKKWAAAKFDVAVEDIESVSIEPGIRYGGYCETCSYEEAVWEVIVYGDNYKRLAEETFSEYSYDMPKFIKEISEA